MLGSWDSQVNGSRGIAATPVYPVAFATTCFNDAWEKLIGHNFIGSFGQNVFERPPPGDPQFSIDMHEIDSSSDRLSKVFIIVSRPAVQSEKDSSCLLDLSNSVDIHSSLCFLLYHAREHAVHVANRWSKDVDSGRINELFGFFRRCEIAEFVPSDLVNVGTRSYITDFSLCKRSQD